MPIKKREYEYMVKLNKMYNHNLRFIIINFSFKNRKYHRNQSWPDGSTFQMLTRYAKALDYNGVASMANVP